MNRIALLVALSIGVSGYYPNQAWSTDSNRVVNKRQIERDDLFIDILSHQDMEIMRLQKLQVDFPKKYRLSRFMDASWADCAQLTIERNGDYKFVLADGRTGSQLKSVTRSTAINLWGKPANHYIHIVPYTTFSLQTLVDDEPTIYHVDMEFSNEPAIALTGGSFVANLKPKNDCIKYRVRGPGITEEEFKATAE